MMKCALLLAIVAAVFIAQPATAPTAPGACDELLVNGVADSALSASTVLPNRPDLLAFNAKINAANVQNAWIPANQALNEWIQVEFPAEATVVSVLTQGRVTLSKWVTEYTVSVSNDGNTWTQVNDTKGDSLFTGNTDATSVFEKTLQTPTLATFVRIYPIAWVGPHISLRFDIRGCYLPPDECSKDPTLCSPNGICKNLPGDYECFCKPGYSGDHCEIDPDVDECSADTTLCSNPNGTCINTPGSYTCCCNPGYSGDNCDIDINECDSNPCYEGVECIDSVNDFTCVCPRNRSGRLCELQGCSGKEAKGKGKGKGKNSSASRDGNKEKEKNENSNSDSDSDED